MLSVMEKERSALQEKLSNVQRELASTNAEYTRLKREMEGKCDQQSDSIGRLESELKTSKMNLENTKYVWNFFSMS